MKLYSRNDLKDSRIFFDKTPPNYMTVLIIFITLLIISLAITAGYVKKAYIINASGVAETTDSHYVSVLTNGEVGVINKAEGEFVKKDDILFIIGDGQDVEEQETLIQPQINMLTEKVAALELYIKSLNDGVNYLSNSGIEQTYFGRMEFYLSSVVSENYSSKIALDQFNDEKANLNKLYSEKRELEKRISNELGDKLIELQGKLDTKIKEIETHESLVKQQEHQINEPTSQTKQAYLQYLSDASSEKNAAEEQIQQLKGQQTVQNSRDNVKQIKANNDGYIHYLSPIKPGISLQMNQMIAEISTNETSELVVVADIPAPESSKIEIGQAVNIEIQGVNVQKYGTLPGKIESITNGTLTEQTQQGNILYYQCTISLDKTTLTASNGDEITLKKFMPVGVRIIYNKETYLDWIKELLSFKS